jgi:hypothetical protein
MHRSGFSRAAKRLSACYLRLAPTAKLLVILLLALLPRKLRDQFIFSM